MDLLRRIPMWIAVLIALDVAIVLAPAIDAWFDSPYAVVRNFLNLDSEHSMPAWYSSIQWFCAGVLFGLLAADAIRSKGLNRPPGLVSLAGLALLCVVFSAEEIVGIHEWLGHRSDALLPGEDRANTALWRTGIWPVLLGIPVVAVLAGMLIQMRRMFLPAPHALRLLIIGLALMFAGAILVELAANLIDFPVRGRGLDLFQLICEEFLEMLGVTLIVWSGYELLLAHGFELRTPDRADSAVKAPRSDGYPVNPAPGRTILTG